MGIYRCRHVVTPFLISCLDLFLFLFFSTSLKQTNKATNEIHLRGREIERSTSLSSIYLFIYLSTYLSIHHHVQQGTTTRIYRSGNLQLSPRALRTPRPSSIPRRMDSTCCRYVLSFIQVFNNFLGELFVLPKKKHSLPRYKGK